MEKNYIVGILLAEASKPEKLKSFIETECPYDAFCTAKDGTILAVYTIPKGHEWWLKWLQDEPHIAGLTRAEVFFSQKMDASSPWSRGEARPEKDVAPCGAECGSCPKYQGACIGCPATKYHNR